MFIDADMDLGDAPLNTAPAGAPGYAPAPQSVIDAAIAAEEAPTPQEQAIANPVTNVLSALLAGRKLQQVVLLLGSSVFLQMWLLPTAPQSPFSHNARTLCLRWPGSFSDPPPDLPTHAQCAVSLGQHVTLCHIAILCL